MNLQQLTTFLWVARLGGVRRAALQMHLSQPAVSARITALEERLGTLLFERHAKGVSLTAKGHLLYRYTEQITTILEDIKANVADADSVEATLRIGVSETIVYAWLPDFTNQLNQAFPQVSLELSVDISLNLRDALLDRSLDLAILLGPISHHSVENITLTEVALQWYKSPGLEEDDAEDPGKLFSRYPVVTYAKNTRPYDELKTELLRRYGPKSRLFPSTSLTACFRMVGQGIGLGALPSTIASQHYSTAEIETFDPGWLPSALHFTASWLTDPPSFLARRAAEIAHSVAINHTTVQN